MKKTQIKLNDLANLCLLKGDEFNRYSNEDLVNATIVFSHFLMDIIYKENQHLSFQNQCKLAEESGKAIRELILATTGKDMHKLIKE